MRQINFWTKTQAIALLTVFAFSAILVNAGEIEPPSETWFNKWSDDVFKDGESGDVFNRKRANRIREYLVAATIAGIERDVSLEKAAKKLTRFCGTPETTSDGSKEYVNAAREADAKWIKAEKKAYADLVRKIGDDYAVAVNERAKEYRQARLIKKARFNVRARSRKRSFYRFDSVKGTILHPKVESGQERRLEWEIADDSVLNPDAHNLCGAQLYSKEITLINDVDNIGILFFFEVKGPDYNPMRTTYREASGEPWCAFKLTEKTCVGQARRDLWNVQGDRLAIGRILLCQVGFRRARLPKSD